MEDDTVALQAANINRGTQRFTIFLLIKRVKCAIFNVYDYCRECIKMKILGIDPGYAIVGYGVVEYSRGSYSPVEYGAITTEPDMPFPKRLQHIYNELVSVIIRNDPDEMAVERLYFQNNQKTAIAVAEARGVILLSAQMNNIPISEYTPLQVKQAVTGFGQAKKPQVMEMTRRLLKLQSVPKPDDTADALAIAICHVQSSGTKLKDMLNSRNKVNLNSLGGQIRKN